VIRHSQNKAVIFVTCELLQIESNLASSVPYYTIRMLFPNRNGCLVLAEAMNMGVGARWVVKVFSVLIIA
jgi:hypothetical protein